ncbi:RBBP9/YdeN family alpha/beta hydrolase [Motilibacter deserti]|uniref:Alpha/beta hydrolase n=1 Tax=Motilibacter deserti TaxID=2714956 RepID=A0ABX0GXI2_9ACTN|nr:alpha/beta hydrolase [Motilibacter deserti]NHC14297.1 alpha/beta hydrolase [Motilibacter deserti]
MTRSFLILHGWQNTRPPGHWQRWLAEQLEAGGERVAYPQLPDPDEPRLDVWTEHLLAALDTLPAQGRTVVCHSLACLLWLHAAARPSPVPPVDRLLLVAPPSGEVLRRHIEVAAFAGPAASAADVRASALSEARLVAADDDPYCPAGAAGEYARALELELDLLPGQGHLSMDEGYGPWPSVLRWCLEPGVRVEARAGAMPPG